MKERPILFSAPMVQAILAGNKTQTRRVFKQLECSSCKNVGEIHKLKKDGSMSIRPCPKCHGETKCAYGKVGDRLWVRETWSVSSIYDNQKPCDMDADYAGIVRYKADGYQSGKLRPSIFMPRWASRILLEITGVRVERLHDISEQDAIAEGIEVLPLQSKNDPSAWYQVGNGLFQGRSARAVYLKLWESINGHESLKANPWVWVIEFKVIEAK